MRKNTVLNDKMQDTNGTTCRKWLELHGKQAEMEVQRKLRDGAKFIPSAQPTGRRLRSKFTGVASQSVGTKRCSVEKKADIGEISISSWRLNKQKVSVQSCSVTGSQMDIAMDSEASDSVMPRSMCQRVPILESVGSRKGVRYTIDTVHTVPNERERRIRGRTAASSTKNITMQVADVHRPLCAMNKECNAGHRIILDDEGSDIQPKATGQWTRNKWRICVGVLGSIVQSARFSLAEKLRYKSEATLLNQDNSRGLWLSRARRETS